jgi:hypothetical protein
MWGASLIQGGLCIRKVCIAVFALVGVASAVWSAPIQINRLPLQRTAGAQIAGPANTQARFQTLVNGKNWATGRKQQVLAAFSHLPSGMQSAVATALVPGLAAANGLPSLKQRAIANRAPVFQLATPYITDVWPDSGDGCPNAWLLVYGIGVNANCQIWFNGSARTTYYMPWGEDFGECVGCELPTVPIAHDYELYLKDTAANKSGAHMNYRVVAPRGWRGNHGWKWANFGEATIPWEQFRHYFGANEVEDAVGNHLPAAQAWYNSTYKTVGAGGNCFGMTLSAERFFFDQTWCYYDAWWNANDLSRAWDYEFINETHRTVNEHQGAQLEASIMANKLWLKDNQNHNQAWERCRDLLPQLGVKNNPMLSIYGSNWGHCVWPYRVEEVGNTRKIYIWDNNDPYHENETSDPTTVVQIDKTTGHLTWGSAVRILCRSYHDCTPADPHLPTEATDGDSAMMNVVVADKGARVTQIRDGQGHTFYANGAENENPSTRIPNSMRFIPDTGTQPNPDFPLVYLFGNTSGKSLDVELEGVTNRTVRSFAPGLVFEATPSADRLMFKLDKMLTNQAGLLLSQQTPCRVRTIMRVGNRNQRVIDVNLLNGASGLLIKPNLDKTGVDVENRTGAQVRYELEVQGFEGGKLRRLKLPTQNLGAHTGVLLAPTNWTQLQDVKASLRNLQTGAAIRQDILR